MKKNTKIKWNFGDVFLVPLLDKSFATGQVLDLQMPNIVRIALYDENIKNPIDFKLQNSCKEENLISLVASSREQLDFDVWKIVGNKDIQLQKSKYPNEQFKSKNWVGAKHYDAGLVEDFLDSFYSFLPWDDWFNPNYLDEFLIDLSKKPKTLIYKKSLS